MRYARVIYNSIVRGNGTKKTYAFFRSKDSRESVNLNVNNRRYIIVYDYTHAPAKPVVVVDDHVPVSNRPSITTPPFLTGRCVRPETRSRMLHVNTYK